jgi:hypothetical protein
MCRDVLRWLLALPGLRVPQDCAQPGERCVSGQERVAHSLFGDIPVVRNYYHRPADGHGRFPLDEALGLIDGYTPGVASLIGRCAAEHPFQHAEKSFRAYTGLTVDARQFPRLSEHIGPLVEQFLRANLTSHEKKSPRVYVATDGTGAPLRHEELKGRKGRQPDGTAQTHEIKVGAIFTQHPVNGQKPWRDLDSNTYVATTQRAEPFGQMMRTEFCRRFPDPPAEVAFLGDGAAWNWELQRVFFPMALGIVDFYHAAEHVSGVVDLVEDRHTPSGRKRRRRWVKLLLRGRLDVFLDEARRAFPPDKTRSRREGPRLLREKPRSHALPLLPRPRLLHRLRRGRGSLQDRCRPAPQGLRHALVRAGPQPHPLHPYRASCPAATMSFGACAKPSAQPPDAEIRHAPPAERRTSA